MGTILIVDDSAVDRRVLESVLKNSGEWTVETACNGREALDKIEQLQPMLIVTDLQMPELDGLQLVGQLRMNYPEIPIILTTAHGSEDLAMEALDLGVASYVPKAQAATKLQETVKQVLEWAGLAHSYERLAECLDSADLSFTLTNEDVLVDPLVEMLQEFARTTRIVAPGDHVRLGASLQGALLHCLWCGNLELSLDQLRAKDLGKADVVALARRRQQEAPYADRKLSVQTKITREQAVFTVTHEGPGFSDENFPDLSGGELIDHPELRGLVLLRAYMDELTLDKAGRRLTMVKRRPQ